MARIIGNSGSQRLAGGAADDLIYGFDPHAAPRGPAGLSEIAASLGEAVFVTTPPGDPSRLFVVDKAGLIRIVDAATGVVLAEPFLDISAIVRDQGEGGLLGLAFHPDYATNGRFFVYYSQDDIDTEVREFRVSATDPNRADPASGRQVLEIAQPDLGNHKAGWIGFGPDGFLHVATGDGGGGGDSLDSGQDITTLLGKILRLDIDRDAFPGDPARNYAIPAGNPFLGAAGADEIRAHGLRNPFRDGFDRGTGLLFIGDVGQDRFEEINIGAAGANFGWRRWEGNERYDDDPLPAGAVTFPVHVYAHADGDRSVIGGYVHRSPASGLHDRYVFGDFVSGRVWTLDDADGDGTWTRRDLLTDGQIGRSSLVRDPRRRNRRSGESRARPGGSVIHQSGSRCSLVAREERAFSARRAALRAVPEPAR